MKIHKQLASKLHAYLDLPVIPKDTSTPKPSYPYVAYKFTSPYIDSLGDVESTVYNQDEDKLYEVLEMQPQMVISIDVYSKDQYEALSTIKRVYNWFKWFGKRDIYDLEIVIVEIDSISDRTFRIEGFYEYRYGFDVRIRTHDKLENEVGYIDKIKPRFKGGVSK